MGNPITKAEKIFEVGESVYFRSNTMGRAVLDDVVRKMVQKHGAGPHIIIRTNIDESDGGQKLKFEGSISDGLGEDAPSPSMEKEMVWDSRYFSSIPRT